MLKNKKFIWISLLLCVVCLGTFTVKSAAQKDNGQFVVVIDAGHGGMDPGKVGINQALEKDINLSIAKKLKMYLEQQNITCYMTREEDSGLYDEDESHKKVQDMKRRVEMIETLQPDLVVSVHQNSYPSEEVCGSQVFFYKESICSKELAKMIQMSIQSTITSKKQRQEKANSSYYLLKKTSVPIVIVECGFLSNREEANKLVTQEYQERMAWAIHLGIIKYRNERTRQSNHANKDCDNL